MSLACEIADLLNVEDLFVIGLALDMTGAVLLVRGLIESPREIAERAGSYYGYNPHAIVERAGDRIDAIFGLGSLLGGFGLQVFGYAMLLASNTESETGWPELLFGLAIAAASAATVSVAWFLVRGRLVRQLLVRVALGDGGWTREKAATLLSLGQAAGHPMLPGEGDESKLPYLRRVFGLHALTEEDIGPEKDAEPGDHAAGVHSGGSQFLQ